MRCCRFLDCMTRENCKLFVLLILSNHRDDDIICEFDENTYVGYLSYI